jgi:hypothetical protein
LRLTSTHTLRPSLGGCHPCNRSVPKPQLEYGSLTMGLVWRWSVHDIWPIVSGPVFMRKTRRGRDLEILTRRSGPPTGESLPPTGESSPPTGESLPSTGESPVGPPTRPGYISLVHLAGGQYIYIYIFPTIVVLAALPPGPLRACPARRDPPGGPARGPSLPRRPPRRLRPPSTGESPAPAAQPNPNPPTGEYSITGGRLRAPPPRLGLRHPPLGPTGPRPGRAHLPLANWRALPPGAGPESGWGARTPSGAAWGEQRAPGVARGSRRVRAPGLTRTDMPCASPPPPTAHPHGPCRGGALPSQTRRARCAFHIPSDHRWGDATRAIAPCPNRS